MTETESTASTPPSEQEAPISMAEFLETSSPNQVRSVSDAVASNVRLPGGPYGDAIATPDIQLHCTDDACNRLRFFRCISERTIVGTKWTFAYINYKCSNCQRVIKTFAIAALQDEGSTSGKTYKLGEIPPFGPPTPPRLIKLIGPDRDLFLQGRRCENQGLGIGAFVYYRRVVENQKNRIISEIIKVASKLGVGKDALEELESALKETQFSKALESVKHGIPQTLLINGHNPLLLLHNALSDGVHGRNDAECLELASYVRVVLVELADRLSQALKDEAELNNAVSMLAAIRSKS